MRFSKSPHHEYTEISYGDDVDTDAAADPPQAAPRAASGNARFDKYETFLAEAAAKLKHPITDDRVRLLAALKLNHESLLERMIRGDIISPDHVTAVSKAIEEMLPPDLPKTIGLKIVQSVVGLYNCQHCGARNELKEGEYEPKPERRDPPPVIDATANEVRASPENEPKALPKPAASPEPPMNDVLPRGAWRSDGTDGSWKNQVGGGSNPFGVTGEPNPQRSNGHTLPGAGSLVWFGTK
jgi:hypothetical protein